MSTKNIFLFLSFLITIPAFAHNDELSEINSQKSILVYCIEKLEQELKQFNREVPKSFYALIQQASSDDFFNENVIEQVMQDLKNLIEDSAIQDSALHERLKSLEQSCKDIIIERPRFEADEASSKKALKQCCNLFVSNLLKVCGQVFVEGQVTINPRTRAGYPLLVVNGDATIEGTLTADNFYVSGSTTLGDVLFDDATVGGTLTVTGNTTLSTLLAGASILSGLAVSGNASVGNTLTTTNLTVTTTANLPPMGNTTIFGTLDVQGATTLQSTLSVTGNSSLSTLSTSGAATLNSLGVTNNATVGGTLGVTGTTTLGALNADATSVTTLSTSGLATLNSASVTTTLGVTGVSTFNSTVNMTPSTAVDALNITPNSGAVDGIQINNPTNAGAGGLAIRINNAVPSTVFSVANTTGNTSITGTLGVTGATSLSTLSTSGLATLNSASVTTTISASVFNITSAPSTGTTNLIMQNSVSFIHNIGGTTNFFAAVSSGNNTLTGTNNTCVGTFTGTSLTTGAENTFIGAGAGNNLTNGTANVMAGRNAGSSIVDGSSNCIIGYQAGLRFTAASTSNTCLGMRAGIQAINAVSNNNIFIGRDSGFNFRGGSNNIMIGTQGPSAAFSNRFYLGSQTQTSLFLLSDAGAGTSVPSQPISASVQYLTIDTTTGSVGRDVSSLRYKTNITSLPDESIDILNNLRPAHYTVKNSNNAQAYGLIAEEVADIDPILVSFDRNQQPEGVHYQMIIPLLIKAYQQQKKINGQLLERIQHLENQMNAVG